MGSRKVRLEENEMAEGNKKRTDKELSRKGGLIVTGKKNESYRGIQRR